MPTVSERETLAYPEAHPAWCGRVHCFDGLDGEALHTKTVATEGEASVDLAQGVEPIESGVAVSEIRATLWFKGNDGPEGMTASECRSAAHVLMAAADALDRIEGVEQP